MDDSSHDPLPQPATLLDRPPEQRLREFKYRCAQSIVFGVPVLALQYFGHSLGGTPREADRWIAILQALLCGWVVYVAATGMLFEGILQLPHSLSMDLFVALLAIAAYLFSFISTAAIFLRGQPLNWPRLFHWIIILLAVWCGWRWRQLSSGSISSSRYNPLPNGK
jgi:cation transport ATPase